ncbi:hypothetical protein PENTCL1PPCAC_5933 [Pristionchus entomophagus]|uniref:MIF4G domain-containing protein n=1 Tax=Pristionchus entomophagus TaxID=358040 RepID=A0AAV5ST48_9BILA|nr:hypothetical protein PENTCL1PPCAC_5933 [Pristionchus entomophagus]
MGGVQSNHQQQQPMHGGGGGGVPSSVAPQSLHQGNAPMTAPTGVTPVPNFVPNAQQSQQPRPPAPPVKARKILEIVDPTTQTVVNQNAIEDSKKEEDAPKAEKEEVKGTDETDSAAVDVKKQFAAQILEETTKSDQPAPALTPAAPPVKQQNKCLFSLDQIEKIGLLDKAAHLTAPTVPDPVAAAPAAEQPVVEEEEKKETSPEVTPAEMPATNKDEQPEEPHLADDIPPSEEPASSSSDKNTSNDSAICLQSPPPPTDSQTVVDVEEKKEEKEKVVDDEKTVVVEEKQNEAEEEKEEPVAVAPEETLTIQLEKLVIAGGVSQDEEMESEPSTPAPVTPSVSETTATLAEEEEDAEKAAAAAEEERQRYRAELEADMAKNMEDIDQFNEEICRYNREYLYNVRDLEKNFNVTDCPLTPNQLKDFGICRSLVSSEPKKKNDGQGGFMPAWGRGTGGGGRGGGGDRAPYKGRNSEHHGGRGGGRGGQGSNKKLPPSIRPSIERRVDTNVQLHKAEKAWKPEKVTETDESEEARKKLLLKTIRSLFNKITPTTKDALIGEFLRHDVYKSDCLNDVISIIFDKAVEEPKFCPLYSNICNIQVAEELKLNNNVSNFRNAILVRAQETFTNKTLDEFIEQKQAEIEAETDEKKKKEKQIELLEAQSKFRRRKFGNITFIGQLYLNNLISVRIILYCVVDLLKSVSKNAEGNLPTDEPDEESIDCAVRLLDTIGKRLQEDANKQAAESKAAAAAAANPGKKTIARTPAKAAPAQQAFPIDMTFQTLEGAMGMVSSRIKFMILNLVELRKNGWVPRKTADAGPKKLDDIKKDIQKEQMENLQQQQLYDRKHSRQEQMGGRGSMGGGGHGGGGGGGGNNPKRQIIQRNSQDNRTIEDRRSQAFKSSNLATRNAPQKKASLSSVTASDGRSSLGGDRKGKWASGAGGGSENSKKEDRAAAMQAAARIGQGGQRSSSSASMKGAEDQGANASGTATQVNSEDEREQNEQREKQEADVAKRILCDVGDYVTSEITLDEVREEILTKIVGAEKFSKPSLQTVFKCYIAASIKKPSPEVSAKYGHVLAYCLHKKNEDKDTKGKEEILKGIADGCRVIVEQEQWEDAPKIWETVAEVLINTHMPEDGLFEGAHPSLTDLKESFLNAAFDTRKPFTLFVLVLKRLAEMHYNRDQTSYMEITSWVLDECPWIEKAMDVSKLDGALKDTKMEFADNLHVIMRQEH